MTERILHQRSLVYGVADQVRHDRSVYAMIDEVSGMTDWVSAMKGHWCTGWRIRSLMLAKLDQDRSAMTVRCTP